MNSRKWQVGMVLLVVLSLGLFVAFPPIIRALRLDERISWIAVVYILAVCLAFVPTTGFVQYWGWSFLIVSGAAIAGWLYRPLPKET